MDDRITIYGSFTSSSSYKPMLFLALARLAFSFKTVNLKTGAQHLPGHLAINRYAQVPVLQHRGLTIVQSNVILDYLARVTGTFDGASDQERWQVREWLFGKRTPSAMSRACAISAAFARSSPPCWHISDR